MFERFTKSARDAVTGAESEAIQLGHSRIGTEHLLLAMLRRDSLAYAVLIDEGLTYDGVRGAVKRITGPGDLGPEDAEALSAIGIDLGAVRAKMEESFGDKAFEEWPPGRRLRFDTRAKKVLGLALREAVYLKHGYVGTEHILLGIVRDSAGVAAKVIVDSGVSLADLHAATLAAINRAAA
jgi:ATP-dependent Clp protease ATP-binding subunit ClpA